MKKTVILAIAYGFYIYGELIDDGKEDGFLKIVNAAMSGGFEGGKGIAGVARGDEAAKIKLDRFDPNEKCIFPLTSVVGIFPSIDLYKFKGTTIR